MLELSGYFFPVGDEDIRRRNGGETEWGRRWDGDRDRDRVEAEFLTYVQDVCTEAGVEEKMSSGACRWGMVL
jgi:hypothetical protein